MSSLALSRAFIYDHTVLISLTFLHLFLSKNQSASELIVTDKFLEMVKACRGSGDWSRFGILLAFRGRDSIGLG